MREKLLISACLLGRNCKYNGGNNHTPLAEELKERFDLVPVCPEAFGLLPIPHDPSERVGDRVLSKSGEDVTQAFQKGADMGLFFQPHWLIDLLTGQMDSFSGKYPVKNFRRGTGAIIHSRSGPVKNNHPDCVHCLHIPTPHFALICCFLLFYA